MAITVDVLFFAQLKERFQKEKCRLFIPSGTKSSEIFKFLSNDSKEIDLLKCFVRVAVNRKYALEDTVIREGDEVALIPPVTGG